MLIKIKKNNIEEIVNQTLNVLKGGGLVVFPSDTVYGLLCDATDEKAVKKLIQFKNRPPGKAISVFCDFDLLNELVKITKGQEKVIKEILPGPFTIILPSKHKVCKLLESEKGTLGVRIPMYRYIEVLIDKFKKPITATSANIANRPSHYSIKTLLSELSEKQKQMIDLVIDFGQLPRNKPSTVVDLTQPNVKILRQGDVDFSKSKTFLSKSVDGTKSIAKKVISNVVRNLVPIKSGRKSRSLRSLDSSVASLLRNDNEGGKPLIFIIEGEMGVGKTVFVKGLGESLGIKNIISPTFVIYYEYGNFYHFDLYQIEDKEEFKHLRIDKLLKPKNILCFEWGEKAGEIIDLLKSKGKIVYVKMDYVNEREREIEIKF